MITKNVQWIKDSKPHFFKYMIFAIFLFKNLQVVSMCVVFCCKILIIHRYLSKASKKELFYLFLPN